MMPTLQTQILWMKRVRIGIAATTALASIAFYFFAYRPSTNGLRALIARTAARQIELRDNQAKSSIKTEIAAKNERLRLELERIRKPSKQSEFSQLVKDLTLYANQSNLRPFNYKPGMPGRSDLFMEMPLSLTFEGDFVSVAGFLRSIEDMQRLTRVRRINIKSRPDRNDGSSGQVQASVDLNIYFATE